MPKISRAIITLVFIAAIAVIQAFAQDAQPSLLKQVIKQNQAAVDAIAMYPPETRKDIFEVSMYPEVIVQLNAMQKSTDTSFQTLIAPFNQADQEKFYDITRYPDLISELVNPPGQMKSDEEIDQIVAKYPDEIQPTARDEAKKNYNLLTVIDQWNKQYDSLFNAMLIGYPPEADSSFRSLIKQPEILSLLADNMQLTVLVGNAYKKNPDHVLHKADSLNAVLTAQNTQAAADWQQNINSDPQAQQDFQQAAQDYAEQSGYQPDEVTTQIDPQAVATSTTPYNWWFGYPRWYPYSYWDPYPYWYDWGFYFGPGHHAVFFGTPSAYFMNWYFYYPEHHVKYAHLSNVYYNYFDAHRHGEAYNPIVHSVRTWRRTNADVISADWDKNPGKREQLFKEYGTMEMGRAKYNQKHPDRPVQRQDYVKTHVQKFPDFVSVPNRQPGQKRTGYQPPLQQEPPPQVKPYWKVPDSFKVDTKNNRPNTDNRGSDQGNRNTQEQQTPVQKQNNPPQQHNPPPQQHNPPTRQENPPRQNNPPPVVRQPITRPEVSPDIRTANQFHQGSWQQIQPEQRPVVQQTPQRVVQQQPQRQNPPPPPGKRRQ